MAILIAFLTTQTYASSIVHLNNSSSSNSPSGTTSNKDGITVQGTGESSVQPDRGIVTIGVVTQASTAEGATQSNANTSNAVITALNGIGISNDEIQTVYYYVYTQESCCTGPQTITGYQVTNEFQVTVIASGQTIAQLGAKIGHVIDTAVAGGASQVYGIEFTASSDALQKAQQTALQQATLDASQKAHIIASALGITITGVVSVTSNPVYPQPVIYGLTASSATTTPILPPQSLEATATVQATFSTS